MDSVKVHCPSVPAVLVETFSQAGGARLSEACTTYCASGVPAKVTVTVPSALFWMPIVLGVLGLPATTTTTWTRLLLLPRKLLSPR